MQNFEKMLPRISSEVISPVISPRASMVVRMSSESISDDMPSASPAIARSMPSCAFYRAS